MMNMNPFEPLNEAQCYDLLCDIIDEQLNKYRHNAKKTVVILGNFDVSRTSPLWFRGSLHSSLHSSPKRL